MCRGWLATRQSAGAASLLGTCCQVRVDLLPLCTPEGHTCLLILFSSSQTSWCVFVCAHVHTRAHTHTLLLCTLTFLASCRAESITALKCHSP